MPDKGIRLGQTHEDPAAQIDSGPERDDRDEAYLDQNLQPITDQEMLESLRELERKTGEQLIFRPDEPGPRAG